MNTALNGTVACSAEPDRFRYRPEIDGLRTVAIGLVLIYHAGMGFTGGYVGVDVFFVISGFLITALISKEQSLNQFELSEFWGRRIPRDLRVLLVSVGE